MRVSLIAIVLLGGCVDDRLQSCAVDLTCPIGSTCVDGMFCATRGALDACAGLEEAAPCSSASVSGFCVSGACRTSTCGNGVLEYGELCDDGNLDDTDTCTSACMPASCGDGIVGTGETCDDHPGDATDCPYGMATCMVCDASCQLVTATGNVCGDHVVATPDEVCDDGNTSACGTCDAMCRTHVTATAATGFLVAIAGAQLNSSETFTLDDGAHTVVFELTFGGAVGTGHRAVAIATTSTAAQVATAMISAIAAAPNLDINATSGGGAVVSLVHAFKTSNGNHPITETVADSGFVANGMAGGAAGNCSNGVGCAVDDDCASRNCNTAHICGP